MMDFSCILANKQSMINGAAGAFLSTFSYDTGVAGTPPDAFQAVGSILGLDPGRGKGIQAWAQVTTAVDGATHGITLKCELVQADDAALATNLEVLLASAAIAQSVLVAGYQFRLGTVPAGVTRRYLGFRFTSAVEDANAGNVMAGLLIDRGTVRVTGTTG